MKELMFEVKSTKSGKPDETPLRHYERTGIVVVILERLDVIIKKMTDGKKPDADIGIIDNAQLLQLLKITDRTAGEWRRKGTLPFSKVHGKIYYRIEDIERMMKERFKKSINL